MLALALRKRANASKPASASQKSTGRVPGHHLRVLAGLTNNKGTQFDGLPR